MGHKMPLQAAIERETTMISAKLAAAAAILAVGLSLPATAQNPVTPSPNSAKVYFINVKNGDVVSSPFLVRFGLSGMGVAPVGVDKPNTGHHHLLVDTKLTPDELKAPLAADAKHVHYGAGQTEAMVTLPSGQHTLQLVLGNWSHIPHNPPVMSEIVTITVK
jgi:Domain of unknown function (DUF4399)